MSTKRTMNIQSLHTNPDGLVLLVCFCTCVKEFLDFLNQGGVVRMCAILFPRLQIQGEVPETNQRST